MIRAALALAVAASAARADVASDEAAIRMRLEGWAAAFNARDADTVCDLFADDLVSVVEGAPDAGKAAVCARLAAALAREGVRLAYAVDIHEVLVLDGHAIVRLDWTLTAEAASATETSLERGLDVFRRDPDGAWRIIRFIAFDGP
ncbi:nuclear transport factor 2 family protein [Amaricoccus sp.]|uniref:YybH family protein n=1 Tax=Amaricoccus sp. TaxID=1872485 RepID=UPI001B6E1F9E|nr:nuclear transport factor 2 family protein [Amaricoccus sp.]MBP7001832.1 nuclear transport factor 2 family protein [Amaricoccus sp.]